MHIFGATAALRKAFQRGLPRRASAPPIRSAPYSVSPSLGTFPWRRTRQLPGHGQFSLFRAAAPGDLGPGCYVIKAAKIDNDVSRALLCREVCVVRQVSHPGLITALAAECEASVPYIVLPYLDGITLRRLLDSPSHFPVSFALCLVRQISAGLAAMHAESWLHGQIRPEHAIISPQGHATLIDLTGARRLDSSECDTTGLIPSSPVYSAPESAHSRGRLTAAADVYSLGVLLHEALAGQPPFQASSPRDLMRSHCREAPPDLRRFRPDASLEVAELCRHLLAKEPLRRPAIDQVAQWLAELEIEELAT